MENNKYVITFTLIMTTVAALILAGLFFATKSQAEINEAVFNKRAVLRSVQDYLDVDVDDMSDEEVLSVFDKQVDQMVLNMKGETVDTSFVVAAGYKGGRAENVDMAKEKKKAEAERLLPLYVFNAPGKEKLYILSVRGNGLWDEIWGNVAVTWDKDTKGVVMGASFDHKGETPGLGAEIKDNPSFSSQFKNKKLYKGTDYVSVKVAKGGARDKDYEVDGISGATVTADGVSEMLFRGIQYYEPYMEQISSSSTGG